MAWDETAHDMCRRNSERYEGDLGGGERLWAGPLPPAAPAAGGLQVIEKKTY